MWNDRFTASAVLMVMAVVLAAREHSCSVLTENIPEIELKTAFPSDLPESEVPHSAEEVSSSSCNPFAVRVVDVSLGKRETLNQKLKSMGVPQSEAEKAAKALHSVYPLRSIGAKQKMAMTFEGDMLQKISFFVQRDKIVIERDKNQSFRAIKSKIPLKIERLEGVISTSLYRSLKALNISGNIANEAIQAMSASIDTRQVRSGHRFIMLVETGYDDAGRRLPVGGVCALAFHNGKKWNVAYRFDHKGSRFLNASGQGASSSHLIMPINAKCMRISSKFGLRQHPIRGYTCQHKGVDLAARTGTPVMAAADGVVVKAFYNGAYGKYILIKHAGGYSTAYAHLSRINIKAGDRVKQYQVIGHVGATGSTTGPHLHLEAHLHGKHFNPLTKVSLPSSTLSRQEMKIFEANRARFDALLKV